jgi:hypothetical protein
MNTNLILEASRGMQFMRCSSYCATMLTKGKSKFCDCGHEKARKELNEALAVARERDREWQVVPRILTE